LQAVPLLPPVWYAVLSDRCSVELMMNEINEKVSTWTRLCKRWEKMESNRASRSSQAPTFAQAGAGMCAMEVELRAMRAKADTAPDNSLEALKTIRLSGSRPSA
jgi:hypothetical protein